MPRKSWDDDTLESANAERKALREACGIRIAKVRELRGLSQSQMGKLLSPPRRKQAISQWERGLVDVSLTQLTEIARVLECSVPYLASESSPEKDEASKDLGGEIRKQRERIGLSQAALGEKLGLKSGALGEIEDGLRPVEAVLLFKIASGLGVKATSLIRNSPAQSQCHGSPHIQSVG